MKIIKKSEHYSIEKVNERIGFYTKKEKILKEEKAIEMNNKLLNFWVNYKSKNYK